ncbi:MAG: DNA repair exonuclease [Thermoprotei archaeon]
MGNIRFAHASDIHVGGFTGKTLRIKEEEAVARFVDRCIEDRVDFVVLAGDTFDSNIPPIREALMLSKQMGRLRDAGIRIYTIYGSHGYSPIRDSLIELLAADGVLRVINTETQDPSGVWLNGVHGLVGAKEVYHYTDPALTSKHRPSIFVFHTAIYEANMTPKEYSVPISSLPSGYTYYAAGHLHKRIELKSVEGAPVNYPGPLFLGWGKADLENYFRGADTGFYIVDLEGDMAPRFEYVKLKTVTGGLVEVSSDGKSAAEVVREVEEKVTRLVGGLPSGSIILVKISGTLSSGSRAEVSVGIEKLKKRHGEFEFEVNDRQLRDPEEVEVERGENYEERALTSLMAGFPLKVKVDFIQELIRTLGEEKQEGMQKADYEASVRLKCIQLLKGAFGSEVFD